MIERAACIPRAFSVSLSLRSDRIGGPVDVRKTCDRRYKRGVKHDAGHRNVLSGGSGPAPDGMTDEPSPAPLTEEERKRRASNRRTIVAMGLIVAVFAAPAVYRLGRYLIELL